MDKSGYAIGAEQRSKVILSIKEKQAY